MGNQFRHLLALLLSVSVHLGAGFALGNGARIGAEAALPQPKSKTSITVYLRAPKSPAQPIGEVLANLAKTDGGTIATVTDRAKTENAVTESTPAPTASPAEAVPNPYAEVALVPILLPPESHYYGPNELTEKPQVLFDITPDQRRVLPDIFPLPANVQLLINERGEIDKVIVEESFLSEQAKRFVIDALETIKFHPGRLGATPVKSQLRIEVTLESASPAR